MSEVKAPYTIPGTDKPMLTPAQIVTYPYPPFVVMPDGTYYAMPSPYELAQMVILMRHELDAAKKRISELEEKE